MSEAFVGEIRMFAGNFAPRGWAFCNGQLMAISQNTALFSLLGTQYGGNGQSTFGLPNLQGRVPVGQGQGPGLSDRTMGESFGSETVTLTAAQMPLHGHAEQASTNNASTAAGPSGVLAKAGVSLYGAKPTIDKAAAAVTAAGGNQPHNNLAPYLALNFIIAVQGIFPARS